MKVIYQINNNLVDNLIQKGINDDASPKNNYENSVLDTDSRLLYDNDDDSSNYEEASSYTVIYYIILIAK